MFVYVSSKVDESFTGLTKICSNLRELCDMSESEYFEEPGVPSFSSGSNFPNHDSKERLSTPSSLPTPLFYTPSVSIPPFQSSYIYIPKDILEFPVPKLAAP